MSADAKAPSARPACAAYVDQPNRSPWIAQLAPDGPPRPITAATQADVVVVGAGIAGIATAFFLLRYTDLSVLLVERDRVARGATGRNAGQLTTYFERPLSGIAEEFGVEAAAEAQRGIDGALSLLELVVAEAGATVRVERFDGHLGMFNLHQLEVHLTCELIRRRGGLRPRVCLVSDRTEFLPSIPDRFDGLYAVVDQAQIHDRLEVADERYRAVLSAEAGCANSGLLSQQVLDFMLQEHADRFRYADLTDVQRVVAREDGVILSAGGHSVRGEHVVLCTNGFVDCSILDAAGEPIQLSPDQRIVGRVAYMTAFVESARRPPASLSYIRNTAIGGPVPYVYVTRRSFDRPQDVVTLTCMGGPEYPFHEPVYDREAPFPGPLLTAMDEEVRPFAQPARPPGQAYEFHWHGLMGYNESGIRVVGAHPRHPRLLYNLGCNGVGFLPSIFGGQRVARQLAGEPLEPSVFDPR